jgi:ABC-type glycerol-3-phosphate transport system substrate-binding protein/drug/metabolite transporter superfamily protein YnfA
VSKKKLFLIILDVVLAVLICLIVTALYFHPLKITSSDSGTTAAAVPAASAGADSEEGTGDQTGVEEASADEGSQASGSSSASEQGETDSAAAAWQLAGTQEIAAPGDIAVGSYASADEIDLLYYHMDEDETSHYYLCKLGRDGSSNTLELKDIPGGSGAAVASFAAGGGYTWILTDKPELSGSSTQTLTCLDESGQVVSSTVFSQNVSGRLYAVDGGVWLNDVVSGKVYLYLTDGSVSQSYDLPGDGIDMLVEGSGSGLYGLYGHRDGSGTDIYPLSQGGFGEKMVWDTVPDAVLPGLKGLFLYASGDDVLEYYPESGSSKKLFSFSACGIDSSTVYGILGGNTGTLYVCWEGTAPDQYRVSTLTESAEGYLDELIILASLNCTDEMRELVALYNRSGRPYVVQIEDYADQAGSDAEFSDAQTRLNADLTAGDSIDMVDLSGIEDRSVRRQYAKLGLLEDLYAWMDRDPGFSREDFQTQVWKANEIDGCLYNLVPFYKISTVFGMESVYGERTQISPEEVFASEDPLKVYGQDYTWRDVLRSYCKYVLDGSSDDVRGQIGNTERLQQLFRFASAYPDEIQNRQIDDMHDKNQWMRAVGEGEISGLGRTLELYLSSAAIWGENVCIAGYPTDTGAGSAFQNVISLGMCVSSDQKEGVWDFFCFALEEAVQNNTEDLHSLKEAIPVRLSSWESSCQTEMSKEPDSVGVGITREDEQWYVMLPVITQEQVDGINQLISQITRVDEYDVSMYSIFEDEMAAYRNGTESLEESVSRLQSRASNYLDEME